MFSLCLFLYVQDNFIEEDDPFLTKEQHFVGTSLHQHSSSRYSILAFNGRFDFEQKRELDEI